MPNIYPITLQTCPHPKGSMNQWASITRWLKKRDCYRCILRFQLCPEDGASFLKRIFSAREKRCLMMEFVLFWWRSRKIHCQRAESKKQRCFSFFPFALIQWHIIWYTVTPCGVWHLARCLSRVSHVFCRRPWIKIMKHLLTNMSPLICLKLILYFLGHYQILHSTVSV